MNNLLVFALLAFTISIFISSCKDKSTDPEIQSSSLDQKLVGTWSLTKIITTVAGQPVELTPEVAGLSTTVTFNSDLTFSSTSTDSDGTTTDTGTWSAENGNLTIDITDDEPETTPYSFLENGDVSIEQSIEISEGNSVLATLVFTKQ